MLVAALVARRVTTCLTGERFDTDCGINKSPTVIVAGVAPWVGRQADAWGRRPLLLLCFAALALRGVFFALVSSPYLIVAVQILDGVCAAVLGVVLPLVVADVMRGTGRFNLGSASSAARSVSAPRSAPRLRAT